MPTTTTTQLSEASILARHEKTRLQNNARSKKYYNKGNNKANKLAKMKEKREKEKSEYNAIIAARSVQPETFSQLSLNETNDEDEDEDENRNDNIYEEQPEVQTKTTNKKISYTLEEMLAQSEEQFERDDVKKASRIGYRTDIKRIYSIMAPLTFAEMLKNPEATIKKIKEATYRGKAYAPNSLKQTFQQIVILMEKKRFPTMERINLNAKQKKTALKKFGMAFNEYKDISLKETIEKRKVEIVPTFQSYLKNCKAKYGENSKEYLISYLYSQFTIRDNYKNMKVYSTEKKEANLDSNNDGVHNFLFYKKRGNHLTFIINDYKTAAHYEKLKFVIKDTLLKKLLLQWIANQKISLTGGLLFGKASLSTYVSALHKKLGYSYVDVKDPTQTVSVGGINFYRHMRVTNETNKNMTFKQRSELAEAMGHSILTQGKYQSNLEVL